MSEFKDKTVLCWDNGLFVHVAQKLSESFGRVLYGTPSVSAFPRSNGTLPGDGLDEITRIVDFWPAAHESDLIVFPDVMFADMQLECERQGMRVFGARLGENMELKRWGMKKLLKSLNMPVAESHMIVGIKQLREFIQDRPDFWIKTSRYRGDFETFRATDYDDVKPRLDELEYRLGMKSEIYQFIVEKQIDAVLEMGYDGYTIRGEFPESALFGIEQKDLGYIGVSKPYADLPECVKWCNAKLKDWLAKDNYCGFYSTEIRCQKTQETDRRPPEQWRDAPMIWNLGEEVPETGMFAFFTDPCCRCASPPSEAYIEWLDNWDEIIWHGAKGKLIDAKPNAKFAVEIMLHSSWADRNWQPVRFPEEMKRWIKLRNMCRIDGVYSAVPQDVGLPEIGAVVGLGNSLPKAIELAMERAAKVKGYYIEPRSEAIQKTLAEIAAAEDQGIKFSDEELPTADEVEDLQPAEA